VRAQGHALEVEGHLGDLGVGDRRIALLHDLDLQLGHPGQVGDQLGLSDRGRVELEERALGFMASLSTVMP